MKSSIVCFFLLGLLFTSVWAGSDGGDEKEEEKRELKIEEDDGKVVVRSEEKTGKDRSRIDFEVKTEDGELEMRVEFREKTEDSGAKFRARLEILEVIEYRNDDGTKGYQQGSDTVVQSINFDQDGKSGGFWNPIDCATGDNRYDCTVATSDGQFSAAVHLVGDVTDIEGVPTRPNSLKFDININLKNKANDTYVAVVARTLSKEVQVEKTKSDENEEDFTTKEEKQVSFGDLGFFSWVTTATVAGTPGVEVYNNPLVTDNGVDQDSEQEVGENARRLVFSFQSTAVGLIEWDPKLAAATPSSASVVGVSSLFIAFLACVISIF